MATSAHDRIEAEQLVKIAADWRWQRCSAEHGKPHLGAPSVRVFLRVVEGETRCQVCSDPMDTQHPMEDR
jgi:hypothetical protein